MTSQEPDEAWQQALGLAWDSFRAGTTPVGAVVISGSGIVVARGRGRRYEPAAPPGQLAGSHVAHAEVNALAQLASERHYEDHLLLTTLEPCGMCHGAAVQATVGELRYAAADPYAGTAGLVFGTPQARRRQLVVTGPLDDERGHLAALLHIVWLLLRPATRDHVLAAQRAGLPALTRLAERAETRQAFADAAAQGASLAQLRMELRGMI
jgi:tRNA(Arg) A34 adenosine deaminase TadA